MKTGRKEGEAATADLVLYKVTLLSIYSELVVSWLLL